MRDASCLETATLSYYKEKEEEATMEEVPQLLLDPVPDLFSYDDDASRWQAVRARDVCADGFFVYAVKTTKIYCRPICKARLARRANVRFFPTAPAAQAAGFRACKRCKPDLAGFMPEERAVRQIRALVASRGGGVTGMSLGQMATRSGLSKWHFHRVFKKSVGLTPGEFLRAQRGGDGDTTWPQQHLDLGGDEFGFFENQLVDLGGAVSGEAPTASREGEHSPFSLDDLLAWPEDDNE
ncbi:metal binding domain of ada domain-containing protein [Hirsutella rhossiliensis]|uniref:Metal binding domain of ada domain-containing protein n=1 Tax=Hirsutella rhossiliensis TaxID=111463 RepID=A0A9P8MU60_9HYPO|nr:metal binding domain of ada domain-containing protein [Hirsutella rhossiliensis]KAH0962188.1 metal binding domain of ada domain-containing protein [Hirsutella rhossiliensis]